MREIPLYRYNRLTSKALVSDEDYERVAALKWYAVP